MKLHVITNQLAMVREDLIRDNLLLDPKDINTLLKHIFKDALEELTIYDRTCIAGVENGIEFTVIVVVIPAYLGAFLIDATTAIFF